MIQAQVPVASGTLHGNLVTPEGIVYGLVRWHEDRIVEVRAADEADIRSPSNGFILPGLIDVHCHGGGGVSFAEPDVQRRMSAVEAHRRQGTTSLVASLVTDAPDIMLTGIEAAAAAVDRGEAESLHLEGPFLSAMRCGAQDPRHLLRPDLVLVEEMLAAGRGHISMMTIAPELPGALTLAERLASRGIIPAIGHTDADAKTVVRLLSALAAADMPGHATHLFNGMAPLHHRAPGAAGALLANAGAGRTRVELIADGVHLADATVAMVFDLVGPDNVVLVSDAMVAAGMPDGTFDLGPQRVTVTGGVARLTSPGNPEDASLAGSTSRLLDIVRRAVHYAGVPLVDAVRAASTVPARVLRRSHEIGSLAVGQRADLVVVNEFLQQPRVLRKGKWL